MKTNSESSHFHQSNLPIAHSLLLLLGRRLSTQQSNSSTFPAFAHSISKAKWRGDSDIQERVVHKMSPSRESEKHASVEESLKRARHKYHSENLNRTMINPPLFSFFFFLIRCWLSSSPGCSKLSKEETGNQKTFFSVLLSSLKSWCISSCGADRVFVWTYVQIKVQTTTYFIGTHQILTRMPLNSFSWSICWAFGAKCSWQNFVMVCLSWEKKWGEMHVLHSINMSSSPSLGYSRHPPPGNSMISNPETQNHKEISVSVY